MGQVDRHAQLRGSNEIPRMLSQLQMEALILDRFTDSAMLGAKPCSTVRTVNVVFTRGQWRRLSGDIRIDNVPTYSM
jgi:hypothetical protein